MNRTNKNKKSLILLIVASFFLLFLGSCSSSDEEEEPTLTPTIQQVGTATQKSESPSTPVPSFTPVPVPSLSVFDAQKLTEELFASNINCELPCWKGVRPGVSEIKDIEQILLPLSSISRFYPPYLLESNERNYVQTSAQIVYQYDDASIRIFVEWYAEEKQTTLEMVHISTVHTRKVSTDTWEDVFGNDLYNHMFYTYALSNILETKGQPSEIVAFAELAPIDTLQEQDRFHVLVRYPDDGIYLAYLLPIHREGAKGTICFREAIMDWWLTPPGNSEALINFQSRIDGYPSAYSVFQPFDVVAGISTDDFTHIFDNDENGCVDVALDIWPEY